MVGASPPHSDRTLLHVRIILVVEDEPLLAIDIATTLANSGARVLVARGPKRGLKLAQDPELSAAVVDFRLGDDDATAICHFLRSLEVSLVIYSGYGRFPQACRP